MCTIENRRFDHWILDWTNQYQSYLPQVAKAARLHTVSAEKCFIDWSRYVSCSGSLKTGRFAYQRQLALALIGPIEDTLVESTIFAGIQTLVIKLPSKPKQTSPI